jgi:hypothetical protein
MERDTVKTYLKYSGTESTDWEGPTLSDFGVKKRWEDLPASEKSRIANHYLIGSSTAADFGELKLPVVNPRTGKLNEHALRAVIGGRGAQVKGVSAETLSNARKRAYSLLNSEFDAKLKVPKTLVEGGSNMEVKIKELLTIAPGQYVEEDKSWLEELEEAQVDKLLACAKVGIDAAKAKEALEAEKVKANEHVISLEKELAELKKGAPKVNEEAALKIVKEKVSDPKVFVSMLPKDMREQLEYGKKAFEADRKKLTEHILTNQAMQSWDEETLGTLGMEMLQKVADGIKAPINYEVSGGHLRTTMEEMLLPPGIKLSEGGNK